MSDKIVGCIGEIPKEDEWKTKEFEPDIVNGCKMEYLENKLINLECELGILSSKSIESMGYYEFMINENRISELEVIIKFLKEIIDEIQNS